MTGMEESFEEEPDGILSSGCEDNNSDIPLMKRKLPDFDKLAPEIEACLQSSLFTNPSSASANYILDEWEFDFSKRNENVSTSASKGSSSTSTLSSVDNNAQPTLKKIKLFSEIATNVFPNSDRPTTQRNIYNTTNLTLGNYGETLDEILNESQTSSIIPPYQTSRDIA